MNRLFSFIATLSLLTVTLHSVAATTDNPQLRTILNKHWEAMGGTRNWLKVESVRLNGTIERKGQTVDICIVKKRPNQIRATITLPIPGSEDEKLQVIRAHDGKHAWTATRIAGAPEMHQEELPPEAAAELLADAGVLPPLIKLWREGAELELLKLTQFEGQVAIVIQSKMSGSDLVNTFYLDRETYRIIAFESLNNAGVVTKTTLEDYTSESGIYLPKKSVIESSATGRSVIHTDSIQVGVGIYREYFGIGYPL